MERPKIGRPSKATSSHLDGQAPTDSENDGKTPSNQSNRLSSPPQPVPKPTSGDQSDKSKQPHPTDAPIGNHSTNGHATSTSTSGHRSEPASRPARSTRNPNPQYVDALEWSPHPWSATENEVADLNRQIQSSILMARSHKRVVGHQLAKSTKFQHQETTSLCYLLRHPSTHKIKRIFVGFE